jgi:hypothetical protein
MAAEDERTTIRTTMDLQSYDHEGAAAVFGQRLADDHTGTFHSFAMALSDWDALGRPVSISMTFAAADES